MLYDGPMTTQVTTSKTKVKCLSTKPYHHGHLRQEILCAARQLLEENSIASLSLRAVAKKVGVSHTAPYRHFKDKESLLAGIAAVGFNELAVQMSEAVALHPNDPAGQLLEAGQRYMQLVMDNPQCVQLMFGNVLPCDDTYPDMMASGDFAFDGLKSIIEEGQSLNVFKTGDVELMALAAWASIHGLSLLFTGGHVEAAVSTSADIRSMTAAVTATLLEGLKAC